MNTYAWQLLYVCFLFASAADTECGGDAGCAAEKDAAVMLQSRVSVEHKDEGATYGRSRKACPWSTHVGKYSGGYAGGVSTQFSNATAAKSKCIELGASVCKAITCSSGGSCTVRSSSSLASSPSGETTYVPASNCFQAAPYSVTCTDCGCPGSENVDWKKLGFQQTPKECYDAMLAEPWCGKSFFVFTPGHCFCRSPTSPCTSPTSGSLRVYETQKCADRLSAAECDAAQQDNPCSWTGASCEEGCRKYSSGSCNNRGYCKWQWTKEWNWVCLSYYAGKLYVGGDNKPHWYVGRRRVKATPRERYGGQEQMRPEYMVSEKYNSDSNKWEACGGKTDCFYGYDATALGARLQTSKYTKVALEINIKCSQEPMQIRIPIQKEHNANLKMFYNLKQIDKDQTRRTKKSGYTPIDKEYNFYAQPTDAYPVLRLEVSRKHSGNAEFDTLVMISKAKIGFDDCMGKKNNHAQCLVELEKLNPETLLRTDHTAQEKCLAGNANSNECKEWKNCLDSGAKDLMKLVNNAFKKNYGTLLQEQAQMFQNRSQCKNGGHGMCIDPPSIDIEAFDCNCFDDLKDLSQSQLHTALCNHPNICCDWKSASCGGTLVTTDSEVENTALLTADTKVENKESEGVAATSLDETIAGKRTCR